MIKNSLIAIGTAARALVRGWGALLLLLALYAALLASVYLFFAMKEATVWQLTLTALLAVLAPLLFFILQAATVNFAQGATRPLLLVRRALEDFWKVLLVSLPLIALAVLLVYLLDKLQARFPVAALATPRAALPPLAARAAPPPMGWQDAVLPSLRLLLLGVLLPLIAVQLWLSIAHQGLWATLKRSPRVLARAFAPQAVLVYAIGLFVFGLMPYFIIFTRTPVKSAWGELILFGLRLALAFLFTLLGWAITLGALVRVSPGTETTINTDTAVVPTQSGDVPA